MQRLLRLRCFRLRPSRAQTPPQQYFVEQGLEVPVEFVHVGHGLGNVFLAEDFLADLDSALELLRRHVSYSSRDGTGRRASHRRRAGRYRRRWSRKPHRDPDIAGATMRNRAVRESENGAKDMKNDGILAIWHDVEPAIGDDYERWYFREHLPERLAVPGFVAGRRYEAVSGAPRFLTYYEARDPDVFVSKAYIGRLNDPTPWTTEVLGRFRDTNRTVCRRTWEAGDIRGAWGVALRVNRNGEGDGGEAAAERIAPLAGQGRAWVEDRQALRVELWRREALALPGPTAEAELRAAPDRFIEGAVLAHFAREEDARSAAEAAAGMDGAEAGVYRLLCELRSG